MADISTLIGDLKDNSDVEYWGGLLDEFDQRKYGRTLLVFYERVAKDVDR